MLWWFNDECWDDVKCCDDMMMWCWVLCWYDVESKIGRVYNGKSVWLEGCRIGMCDFMAYTGSIILWIFCTAANDPSVFTITIGPALGWKHLLKVSHLRHY